MIVTAHQPNFLPGMSVVEKLAQVDAVIWLDEVQYSHGGWSNRNRMPDGSWLTVPVERLTDMAPFNRVRISEHGSWRLDASKALSQHYGHQAADLIEEIRRPYRLLIGLNLALLTVIVEAAEIDCAHHFQSHLDGGHAVQAVSDSPVRLQPISDRLARMVAEVGGDIYLSGPSGKRYLDEQPFHDLGIKVSYFTPSGDNSCSARLVRDGALVR